MKLPNGMLDGSNWLHEKDPKDLSLEQVVEIAKTSLFKQKGLRAKMTPSP